MAMRFDGTTIAIIGPGMTRDRSVPLSIRVIPVNSATGIQTVYVDKPGIPARHVTLALFFGLATDFRTFLLTKVGTTGLLITPDFPSPGKLALLTDLQRTGVGHSTNGETYATASFTFVE